MPDRPFPKHHRSVPPPTGGSAPAAPGYAELRCRTNYSFLEGASHPDELVVQAATLGLSALAVTDRNSLAGVVRAHSAAKEIGLKLVIGAEIMPRDSRPILLWAQHRAGYGRLSRLLTVGRRRAEKGDCKLTFADVAAHADGILAGVPLQPDRENDRTAELDRWKDVFGDRCYAVAELHRGPDDERLLRQMISISAAARVPLLAANDVHYHVPERRYLQEVLTAIRLGCSVAELGAHRFPNGERHLKSASQMQRLFAAAPELVTRSQEVADRCTFSLDELRYDYPEELCPAGETPLSHLARLTWAGAADRYPDGVPDKVRQQIEHELKLIEELRYEAYFLTVWDLVRFARSKDILCQGRGSAANSAVCFCLGVTSVDPDRIDVLFERFISKERDEAPDIDIDFEHERREEVLQYVYEKYGRERAGMTAEVITYRPRSAVRDVGKALGLSLDRVDILAKSVDHIDTSADLAARFREAGFNPMSRLSKQMIYLIREILGFPRHLSQHVGGMVLTHRPLCELVPIENASMPGRTVIQWDKDDLDALGILKVDCLALGMLTAIKKSFDLLQRHHRRKLTLATIPAEDPAVYEMIQQADTIGVFQIESRAQMSMLPRLKPKEFYDLVIEVAIVRPGPIQGDMVHPYLRRKSGEEQVEFPSEAVRGVLAKTLGVPLFQEQAMKLAMVAAGFTPGEADQLRRAMGAWRKTGVMEKFRQKMLAGMQQNGYTDEFAERLFHQIRGFGEYGFPESHAASFALLVYASAWIKRYHPEVFLTALLDSQPMGFYAPAQLVADAKRHGVEVRPVDVNHSEWDCTLEPITPARGASKGLAPTRRACFEVALFQALSPRPLGGEGQGEGDDESRTSLLEGTLVSDQSANDRGQAYGIARPLSLTLSPETGARGQSRKCATSNRASEGDPPIDVDTSSPSLARRVSVGEASSDPQPSTLDPQPFAVRLGFRMLSGFPRAAVEKIVRCREQKPFASYEEFVLRTGFQTAILSRLAQADAFHSLKHNRRPALWSALARREPSLLFDAVDEEPSVDLPLLSPQEEVFADYQAAGLSLRDHPFKFLRDELQARGIVTAAALATLEPDRRVSVAGLVLLRQRPGTAKGITFMTLEDETGTANLIVHRTTWDKFHRIAGGAGALIARGILQRQDSIIHIVVDKLEDLTSTMAELRNRARDFR